MVSANENYSGVTTSPRQELSLVTAYTVMGGGELGEASWGHLVMQLTRILFCLLQYLSRGCTQYFLQPQNASALSEDRLSKDVSFMFCLTYA